MLDGSLEGRSSIVCPPLLDGTNYGYLKARLRAFIKSLDELAWKVFLTGWYPPTKEDESSKEMLKSELEWTTKEDI